MDEPSPSESADSAIDAFVDLAMRGQAPDVEAFAAEHPEIAAADLQRLRKLARVLGRRAAPEHSAPALPFESIGGYRLLERLGGGGMGVVYMAEDQSLGRRVALKLVRPELVGSADAIARFDREARAVARLRHENIVTVFGAGREHGVPYLAMELVPGRSLDEVLAEARAEKRLLDVEDVLCWGRDIARALECVHAAGIQHRDVKPSNVRITPEGRAMLLDFGLALDPDSATISRTGQIHGTLAYASPEQVSGDAKSTDPRTDVWSLGVTLYECLTSHLPFTGETSEQILHRILMTEPIAPRDLVPDLSRDLETVVLCALEKERARRYASAGALADDLDAILDQRPIRARPSGALSKAWKWSRRKPGHASAAVLALLVAVGGPTTYAFLEVRQASELAAEKQAVEVQRTIAETRSRELEKMATFQGEMLLEIQPQRMGQRIFAELRAEARAALGPAPDREADGQPRLDAPGLDALERVLERANGTNVAVSVLRTDLIEPALASIESKFADQPKIQGLLLHTTAQTCLALGLAEHALRAQKRSYELLLGELGPDESDTLSSEANYGYFLLNEGRVAEAEPHLRHAAERLPAVLGAESEITLSARHNLALLLSTQGRLDEAEVLHRDILAIRRRTLGDDTPSTLGSLSNLGSVLLRQGRREEAEPILREVHARRARVLGAGDESTLTTANNLAVVLNELGRLPEASLILEDACAHARESLGDLHAVTILLHTTAAEIFSRLQCLEEAEPCARRALEGLRATAGPTKGETLAAETRLGGILRQLKRFDEAEALLLHAYDQFGATIGELHADARSTTYGFALLLRDTGRLAEAGELFAHLAEIGREDLGPAHARTLRYEAERVRAWTALRRFADAARALEAARAAIPAATKSLGELPAAGRELYEAWQRAEPTAEHARDLERWTTSAGARAAGS